MTTVLDPRLARRGGQTDQDADAAFREDLDRIRFSPYFSRLSAVTQVISQNAAGQSVQNRLTHSIKVAAVARSIAVKLHSGPHAELLEDLGGCDPVVIQAAATAHDLGHPPFGHLGERVLDRIARSRFGLADGFEGNAQTFRIVTELDVHGTSGEGLNLTSAVRAALLKYPWARFGLPDPHPCSARHPPKGGGQGEEGLGSGKFSAYVLDAGEMTEVLAAYPRIKPWRQTVECSVMDIADDIAYSLHDLDDFHRAGVLQHASVSAEFRTWIKRRAELERADRQDLRANERLPGYSLELPPSASARQGRLDGRRRGVRGRRRSGGDRPGRRSARGAVRLLAGGRTTGRGVHPQLDHAPAGFGAGDDGPTAARRARLTRSAGLARGGRAQVRPPAIRAGPARPGDVPTRAGSGDGGTGRRPRLLAGRSGGCRTGRRAG